MSFNVPQTVSYDSGDSLEGGSHELREELKKTPKLPFLWPREDREDGAHNVLIRLLEEAEQRGAHMLTLVTSEPSIVHKKMEAEKSRVRRLRPKYAKRTSEEEAQCLPADRTRSEGQHAELIERLTKEAGLSPKESQLISLQLTWGAMDYDQFSKLMGVDKDHLYKLYYESKKKLKACPKVANLLSSECHERDIRLYRDKGGTWRRSSVGRRV